MRSWSFYLLPLPSVQGLEAVGRLRCSRGLAVEKYIGSFYRYGVQGWAVVVGCTNYDSTASPMTAPVPELLCCSLASGRRVETDLNFPALSCDHAFAAKLMYEVSCASA